MSGTTLEEELHGASILSDQNTDADNSLGGMVGHEEVRPSLGIDFSFLTRETGDGEIEDYLKHPMNFKKSLGMAQILRGITGLVGTSLKYALLDIVMGAFRMQREKVINVPVDENALYNNGYTGS